MLPEEQEEILSNLQVQLKNQVRFTSLKILCARKVAVILPLYANQRLIKLFSVLPKTLCSLVNQEFLQQFEDDSNILLLGAIWHDCNLKDKLDLFTGNGLEEFDCKILNEERKLTDGHPTPFEQLARGSPKLKCFKDNRYFSYSYTTHMQNYLLSVYYSLRAMPSLVMLEIKLYPVKDADLKVIGLRLPLLQHLTLFAPIQFGSLSSKISFQGLEYLKNLNFLKQLTFVVDNETHKESVQLVQSCLQLMPQVNTVGTSLGEKLNFVLHEFPSYEGVPTVLGLEHLVLGPNSVIPSNVTLPNVTRITVLENVTFSLKQFKKLKELFYQQLDGNDWSHLPLTEVGHLLRTFYLSLMHVPYHLLLVFMPCKNLEELIFDEVMFENFFYVTDELKNCVQNLRRFKYKLTMKPNDYNCFHSSGLLHLLLSSCPELEELQIPSIALTKQELDLINDDMDAGVLSIQKLQKVEIIAFCLEYESIVSFAQFACKLCVKNYKILKKININEHDNEDRTQPHLEVALKMQDIINNPTQFQSLLKF